MSIKGTIARLEKTINELNDELSKQVNSAKEWERKVFQLSTTSAEVLKCCSVGFRDPTNIFSRRLMRISLIDARSLNVRSYGQCATAEWLYKCLHAAVLPLDPDQASDCGRGPIL